MVDVTIREQQPDRRGRQLTGLAHAVRNRSMAAPGADFAASTGGALTETMFAQAYDEISSWPGYRPTPLFRLPTLARDCGIAALLYKDEGGRFDLGSFKALGGAYAVARVVARELARRGVVSDTSVAALKRGAHREIVASLTVASATDGNHGRSVAWGAQMLGCRAMIFIHETVSEGRKAAIEAYGADVRRVPGGYDDSVRQVFDEARQHGWFVVQDTALGDYREVPADITCGYGVIAEEILRELAQPPTHVIVQAGVGGVASAVAARFWQHWGVRRPSFIVLEPAKAACVLSSIQTGRRVTITGDLETVMAGLSCGEVSELAWDVLATATSSAVAIDDQLALEGMKRLAAGLNGDPPIVGGECSGGPIGALLEIGRNPDLRRVLGIGADASVLVIGTEGATDPAIYRAIVGRDPVDVVRSGES